MKVVLVVNCFSFIYLQISFLLSLYLKHDTAGFAMVTVVILLSVLSRYHSMIGFHDWKLLRSLHSFFVTICLFFLSAFQYTPFVFKIFQVDFILSRGRFKKFILLVIGCPSCVWGLRTTCFLSFGKVSSVLSLKFASSVLSLFSPSETLFRWVLTLLLLSSISLNLSFVFLHSWFSVYILI